MIEFRATRKRSRKVQSTQFEKLLKEVVQTNGIFLFNLSFKNKRVQVLLRQVENNHSDPIESSKGNFDL